MHFSLENRTMFYLVGISAVCVFLIILFQQYSRTSSYSLIGGLALSFFGIALFFFVSKYCEKNTYRLALLGSLYLIVAYLAWPNRGYWLDWHDQSFYYKMMHELSNGYLTLENFRYGIGYPILAVPFYFLIGKDALFIPNLVAFAGTIYLSHIIFRFLSDDLSSKIAILLLIFATTFPYHHVIWWSHGIVIFCFMLICYIVLKNELSNKDLLLIGFVTGYSFFTRYVEVIVFIPMIAFLIWRKRFKGLTLVTFGAIPPILMTFLAHWLIFGNPFMTPYKIEFGFSQSYFLPERIPYNTFLTFLYYPPEMALNDPAVAILKFPVLIWAFFFVFAPLGMYLLFKKHSAKEQRGYIIATVFSVILCVLYSSAYWQFHSGAFGQYPADFRYLLLAFPFLAFFSAVGLLSYIKQNMKIVNGLSK